jgi:hypothetical protein
MKKKKFIYIKNLYIYFYSIILKNSRILHLLNIVYSIKFFFFNIKVFS